MSYQDASSLEQHAQSLGRAAAHRASAFPVAGMVTLDDGRTVPFCIGCSKDSPLEGEEPKMPAAGMPAQPKGRVYWYIQH